MTVKLRNILLFAFAALAQNTNSSSPCAQLQQAYNQTDNSYPAPLVVSCMQTVPFNQNGDARKFYNKFQAVMQFHSSTVWLKDPPPSYLQPGVDLLARMATISNKIDNGTYTNQWDFEMDLQKLFVDTHDGHIYLSFGLSDAWNFRFPLNTMSISADGLAIPKTFGYDTSGTLEGMISQIQSNVASPISQVNGQNVNDFLTNISKTMAGNVERHADFNSLFFDAMTITGELSGRLNSSTFPYGVAKFDIVWENGNTAEFPATAGFSKGQIPPELIDGDSWYSFAVAEDPSSAPPNPFVVPPQLTEGVAMPTLGNAAATSAVDTQPVSTPSPLKIRQSSAGWSQLPAFPPPDLVQEGFEDGAKITGYYLKDVSLGVLSIPTFDSTVKGQNGAVFMSNAFANFITGAKNAGMKKILIDCRSNGGGIGAMATEIFKNFTLWAGSRMRLSPAMNALGTMFTAIFQNTSTSNQNRALLQPSPWVATNFLYPSTGVDFGSWGQILNNAYVQRGDNFTPTMEFDWSNTAYDLKSTGDGIVIDGYGNRSESGMVNPWDPSDIVILHNGICASTCALFSRGFAEVGVKTVAVGGAPQLGPMQGAAGVRGENAYLWKYLNLDISGAIGQSPAAAAVLPSARNYIKVSSGAVNLRDMIRPNASFPQQFAYLPSDCRIFYTPDTYNNYTNLWKYAAHAIWSNVGTTGSCLPNSTAAAVTNAPTSASPTSSTGPSATSASPSSTSKAAASTVHINTGLLAGVVSWMAMMAVLA